MWGNKYSLRKDAKLNKLNFFMDFAHLGDVISIERINFGTKEEKTVFFLVNPSGDDALEYIAEVSRLQHNKITDAYTEYKSNKQKEANKNTKNNENSNNI